MVGESRTRGHSMRIQGRPLRTEMKRHFFTQRVVSLWNSLPQEVVDAKTLNVFNEVAKCSTWGKWDQRLWEKAGLGY